MSSLPELSYNELVNLLLCFGKGLKGNGSPCLEVITRDGRSYPIHCHPSEGLWPQALTKILKQVGISRDEFWKWNAAGRKARPLR